VERVIEAGTRQLSFDLAPEPNRVLFANRGAQMVVAPAGLDRHGRQASLGPCWRPDQLSVSPLDRADCVITGCAVALAEIGR
jgi:hypothetical protein